MSTKATKHGSILLVDDDRHLVESMSQWLREIGYTVDTAYSFDTAIERINARSYDLLLVDVRLGDRDGFDVLRYSNQKRPQQTVVLITGYGSADVGVQALRAGAFDLLTKPLIDQELEVAIDRALSRQAVEQENRQLKAQLDYRYSVDNIIGVDHRMKRIFEMIDSVADTRATVLISGESGTGKSMIARAIHRRSSRADQAFVEVACAALPETLLESELFGHVKGAFTGATCDKMGKFKQADGGTIFLDEIGTAPPSMQVKLLRVLQELEFEQVGGNKTFRVDTRTVLATNDDLAQLVREGRFRQDLYYRVNVINIEIPPLRERGNDIPLLARQFLKSATEEAGRPIKGFTDETLAALQRYNWPGNVRELQNVVSRAVLLGSGDVVDVLDLPRNVTSSATVVGRPAAGRTLKEALEGPERQIILDVLESNNWNRNATADALGINRTTLYKKMKRLGLDEPRPTNPISGAASIGGPPSLPDSIPPTPTTNTFH